MNQENFVAPPIHNRIDLSDLNDPQKEAVTHCEGPLLILAGAGSGKTRVITYRIAYLLECGVKPWNILAVTFTNKAASEMRERFLRLTHGKGSEVLISTFHSFSARFLRMEAPHFGLDRNFTIYDQDDQKKVIKESLRELALDDKKFNCGILASQISREKDRLMDAESFAISATASRNPQKELLSTIYSLYQKKLDKAQALDFGDLIMKTVELLQHQPLLKEKVQERFHHVLVDEYQDTNRAQYMLTKILAAKHKNISVVGDDDQAIYSWRGADVRNILDFEKDYPDVKVVKLEENYRSSQPILTAAWNLVQNNKMRKEKKLWTNRQSVTPVVVQHLEDELEEADWIVRKVMEIRDQTHANLSDFAFFYRTNAQSRVLEDALRKYQIPYVLIGNVRFYERAEVKDLLAYLKIVVNPHNNLSLKRIINFPPRGIGETTFRMIEKYAESKNLSLFESLAEDDLAKILPLRTRTNIHLFRKMLDEWILQREKLTVFELLKKVLDQIKILELLKEEAKNSIESASQLDNLQELMNATEEFEEGSSDKSVRAYLEQVSLMTDIDSRDEKKDGVTLMTVHIAKGLEFPTVFLTGLEEGLFPLGEAQFSQEELEEERRLAYVGMTRAKDFLFLTCAATRRLFGQTRWNQPSRFIQESNSSTEDLPKVIEIGSGKKREVTGTAKSVEYHGDSPFLEVGQRVSHPQFGNGRVVEKSGEGDGLKVVVMFSSGQWKKLLVKYAHLRRI